MKQIKTTLIICIVALLCFSNTSFYAQCEPTITLDPINITVCKGGSVNYEIAATSAATISYQWQVNTGAGYTNLSNNTTYSGVITPTLTVTSAQTNMNNFLYRCIATTSCTPNDTSAEALLTVPIYNITTSQTNVQCNGAATGMAAVTARSGGSGSFSYAWVSRPETTTSITNLTAGTYTCIVTDVVLGCTNVKTITITQNSPLTSTISYEDVLCNGGSTGNARVNPIGAYPFTFSWLPIGGNLSAASNLPIGSYSCTITDNNGCSIIKSTSISQPSALSIVSSQSTNVLCYGASTGQASISIAGGIVPYTYSWLPSTGTNSSVSGLAAGTYTCEVLDANECPIGQIFTVIQSPSISVSSAQSNVSCFGGSNGTASVSVLGGGNGPYSYSWMPNTSTSASVNGLAASSYSCTITDASSCSVLQAFTLTSPAEIIANISKTNACGSSNSGSAIVAVSGGVAPYSYAWSSSGSLNSSTISSLVAGSYSVTTTDANGCGKTTPFAIIQSSLPVISFSLADTICVSSGILDLTASPSGGIFEGSGVVSGRLNTSTLIPRSTYTITYTYSDGTCSNSDTEVFYAKDCATGIDEIDNAITVQVYPNPFIDNAFITLNTYVAQKNIHFLLYDNLGRVLLTKELTSKTTSIYRSNLSAGAYFYSVVDDKNGLLAKGKLIVQ